VAVIVLLSDRSPGEALPALLDTGFDVKSEPLEVASLRPVIELAPPAILVDAAENPGQAHLVLVTLRSLASGLPAVAIVERFDLDRYPWHEVADELLYPGAPGPEILLRLAMLRHRTGAGGSASIRLGPLALDTETYRVTVAGRDLDLTYKEFELLRFLASRSGRVFTRPALLREVWGFDFYGGTRTVDVHVRRLRSKLGPEHEHLIETVRGVGYRAAEA
jgi:DNA-binding response OmpR family regulator